MEAIYQRPRDYDLEHADDDEDVAFYRSLVSALRPSRVLELAAGSGRVTIPLATLADGLSFDIVGLELAEPMLAEARRKRDTLDDPARRRLRLEQGDLRTWSDSHPFDLIITPCSSLSHLQSIDDQLAAWHRAYGNLRPGGRFVVDLTMPNLPVYAESMQTPPRTTLEVDVDARDPDSGDRLLRYKTTRYLPHEQRAEIRFLYDKFPDGGHVPVHRYVSDFECHVYYPREVELLFRCAGFAIESRYGDYYMHPLRPSSRQLIFVGRRA